MTAEKRILVLNQLQIQQKIDRIAYQILEDNLDEQELIIAGILPRGNYIAERLRDILTAIAPFKITLLEIDLDKTSNHLQARYTFNLQDCANKAIVLVDDVLSSGKTLAYGVGVFLNVPLKKLRTAVLVDRNHKSFPMAIDFVGVALSTVIKEHVDVIINDATQPDAVYLC